MGCLITLTKKAHEGSSYFVEVNFFNELKEPTPPLTMKWTLKDGSGNIVNGRNKVSVASPEETTVIPLTGADLGVSELYSPVIRYITIEGTYNSVYKAGASYKVVAKFELERQDV